MKFLIICLILSFSYDLPLFSFYKHWATLKLSDITGIFVIYGYIATGGFAKLNFSRALAIPLLLFFLIAVITSAPTIIFISQSEGVLLSLKYSGYWLIRLAQYILFYFIIYEYASDRQTAYRFLIAFWIGGIFVSFIGLLQHVGIAPQYWGSLVKTPHTITSTLSFHHQHLGLYMLLIIFMTLGLFLRSSSKSWKMAFGLSLLLFIFIELLSLRRSTCFGVIFGLFLWLIFQSTEPRRKLITYSTVIIILGVITLSFISIKPLQSRFEAFKGLTSISSGKVTFADESNKAIKVRLNIMNNFLDIIKNNPSCVIFGRGYMSSPMRYEQTGAHNEFIQFIHDSGVFGLLVFFWLLFSILKILFQHFHPNYDDWRSIYNTFFFGMIALICSCFTGGFFTASHVVGSFLGFFLSLLAVIMASMEKIDGYKDRQLNLMTDFTSIQ